MNTGRQLSLKKLMARELFVVIKVVHSSLQNFTTTPVSKKSLQSKHGIEKFQFHLLRHNFLVEMDMSSFPKMLQFKRKMLPYPQLLRWSNWFSQWSFQVQHIKGKDNVITDYLSRKPQVLNTTIISPPLCVYPITNPSSSSGPSSAHSDDILNMINNLPPKIKDQIKTLTFDARSKRIIRVLHNYLKDHQRLLLAIFPNIDQPWKTPFAFWIT